MKDQVKEEYAIVLDFLPNGYPEDRRPTYRKTAIAQAIGKSYFILLELAPRKGVTLQINEEVYIGEGKRDKINHILGKILLSRLTETAKAELEYVTESLIDKDESRFVEFFNKATPINVRRHKLELLPGLGKKHMLEILAAREESPFKSFEDIRHRIKLMPDPKKAVIKRIFMEVGEEDKYRLFVGVP